ncbi:MAG: hypothetical protein C0391_06480 [Anaerolinea sp.]|nr:hypothetical protein [Anaerolinea sp.]
MIHFSVWYLVVGVLGFLGLPFIQYLLPNLKDKGYSFSRALGLLLGSFIFWLLTSFHILQNDVGGILAALIIFVLAGILISRKKPINAFLEVWRTGKGYILISEGLFLFLFLALAVLRAANPNITGTEKPMELAFINSILNSPSFPPADPWLAGYSISYYYFGYVISALLIKLTYVPSGVGFNLMVSLVFALTGVGMYGLAYNIITADGIQNWLHKNKTTKSSFSTLLLPLFAPLFTLVISNFEGLLEFFHARGLFWTSNAEGLLESGFWKWLDIQELTQSPIQPFSWVPSRPAGIIWWRASRVLSDYNLTGSQLEIIDEFPFFSFLLADLHPHVLALPFAILMLAISLNLILSPKQGGFSLLGIEIHNTPIQFIVNTVLLGGMAFLNTWDFPIYLALFLAAHLLTRIARQVRFREELLKTASLAVLMVFGAVIFYLPFYVGFSSQAGGIIPSFIFSTRGVHFWVMFGPLLIPIFLCIAYLVIKPRQWSGLGKATLISLGTFFLITLIGLGLGMLIASAGQWLDGIPGQLGAKLKEAGNVFVSIQGASEASSLQLFKIAIGRRLSAPGTWVTMLLLGIGITKLIITWLPRKQDDYQLQEQDTGFNPAFLFYLLIILAGIFLTLVPEYFYLRDQFGWRMNTIFKFYYQTWIMWSLAAGVSIYFLWVGINGFHGVVVKFIIVLVVAGGLAYPVIGIAATTGNVKISDLDLDGTSYMRRYNPDEAEAIEWLQQAEYGVVLEAVGGSYSGYARVATLTGQPNLLGWPGHESQWRGGGEEMGSRQSDIETIYSTPDWQEASSLLDAYTVNYIYIGELERSTYRLDDDKFVKNLVSVFQNNSVVIYGYNPEESHP